MSGIADPIRPLPCPCGGFWPDDHVQGCTAKGMSELWPKAYPNELQEHPADTCKRLGITLD